MKEKGQIAIIILLFMLVALTIGLAATQRSLTNITTSSQSEQSSRAFSAAEAGLQRSIAAFSPIVLSGANPSPPPINESELGNSSNANVTLVNNLPRPEEALEFPPIGRDAIAQFWLANPLNQIDPNPPCSTATLFWTKNTGSFSNCHFAYSGSYLNIYWGNGNPISTPAPAIEVNLVAQTATGFVSHRYFFDDPAKGRNSGANSNNFTSVTASNPNPGSCSSLLPIHTSSSVNSSVADRNFYCRASIPIDPAEVPVIIRARILYSESQEPIAVEPVGGCGTNCSLPPQAAIYTSRGFSGQSQKTLQVFRQPFYVSPLLDFALFSAAIITKGP